MQTLEIESRSDIDHVESAESLPFKDNGVDLILTQEVLGHVTDPFQAMCEICRVLKPSGQAYIQLPFIIGYSPGSVNYWMFSKFDIVNLSEYEGFTDISVGASIGPAIGTYWIAVESFRSPARSVLLHNGWRDRGYVALANTQATSPWSDCPIKRHQPSRLHDGSASCRTPFIPIYCNPMPYLLGTPFAMQLPG